MRRLVADARRSAARNSCRACHFPVSTAGRGRKWPSKSPIRMFPPLSSSQASTHHRAAAAAAVIDIDNQSILSRAQLAALNAELELEADTKTASTSQSQSGNGREEEEEEELIIRESEQEKQRQAGCLWWKQDAMEAMVRAGQLSEQNPLVLCYNLTQFRREFARVRSAFGAGSGGPEFIHTMALKANQVMPLLRLADEHGMGFEAASMGELFQALRVRPHPAVADAAAAETGSDGAARLGGGQSGSGNGKIVFDSPVKRRAELEVALREGVYINCDNLQEVQVVAELLQGAEAEAGAKASPRVGIRINPQVGTGAMDAFSTAGTYSKFGVGIDQLEDILAHFEQHRFLNGVMCHVGSQGVSVDLHAKGIRATVDVALEVNRRCGEQRIKFVDIGGGLSVNFASELERDGTGDLAVSYDEYAAVLRESVPELFTGEFPVVLTEFGRRYNAKAGFIASFVEYNKKAADRNIAAVHAGTDLFTRYVWAPDEWTMRVSVFDAAGRLRGADEGRFEQDLAGPCCIAGDVVAHRRSMPMVRRGDFVLFHDQGSYAYSSFSMYNSRQPPAILGFEEDDPAGTMRVLKPAVTVEETMAFFGQ